MGAACLRRCRARSPPRHRTSVCCWRQDRGSGSRARSSGSSGSRTRGRRADLRLAVCEIAAAYQCWPPTQSSRRVRSSLSVVAKRAGTRIATTCRSASGPDGVDVDALAGGGVGAPAGVREKRGAGACWVTPSRSISDPRAAMCAFCGASAKVSTGDMQASVPSKIAAHSSRVLDRNFSVKTFFSCPASRCRSGRGSSAGSSSRPCSSRRRTAARSRRRPCTCRRTVS